jgi:pimeloyl-ACP methyl ester carboxylesterase
LNARTKSGTKRRWLWLVLAVAVGAAGLAASWLPRALEAARVLADVAAGQASAGSQEERARPARTAVGYAVGGRERTGDMYTPANGTGAALVLVPGASRRGKDDPLLVAFAEALARARFDVLVPDIASLRALRVSPANARDVADAVTYLAQRSGAPVGVAAISYAVGPAVLAALEPGVGKNVRFILAIGGYYDLRAAIAYFTTGFFRERADAPWRHQVPNAYGRWVFVRSNAARIADPRDRTTLAAIAERKLADPNANVADLVATLGAEGRPVQALLDNTDPEAVPALIDALPEAVRADIDALDLSRRDLSGLTAPLLLVHGRDDSIIPYSESVALAAAAPRAELYLVDGLAHVELDLADLDDVLTLWQAIHRLLELRDAAP